MLTPFEKVTQDLATARGKTTTGGRRGPGAVRQTAQVPSESVPVDARKDHSDDA